MSPNFEYYFFERLKSLTVELSCHLGIEAASENFGEHGEVVQDGRDAKHVMESKQAFQNAAGLGVTSNNLEIESDAKESQTPHSPARTIADHKNLGVVAEGKHEVASEKGSDRKYGNEEDEPKNFGAGLINHKFDFSTRRCTLTCCAPDGSPLQGWLLRP